MQIFTNLTFGAIFFQSQSRSGSETVLLNELQVKVNKISRNLWVSCSPIQRDITQFSSSILPDLQPDTAQFQSFQIIFLTPLLKAVLTCWYSKFSNFGLKITSNDQNQAEISQFLTQIIYTVQQILSALFYDSVFSFCLVFYDHVTFTASRIYLYTFTLASPISQWINCSIPTVNLSSVFLV